MKKTITYIFLLVLLANFHSTAATYTVTGNQNWSAFGTTPTAADNIVVRGGGNLTVDVPNAVCNNITLGVVFFGTGTLTFNAGSQLTSSGNFNIALFNNGTVNMTAGGTLIADNIVDGGGTGTFICGIGTVKLSGTQALPDFMTPFYNLQITVGTTTLSANTIVSNSLIVDKNTTLNLGTRTLGAPTSLTLETLGGGTGSTITGSGLLTLGGNVTVNYTGAGAITTGATISCPLALGAARIITVNDDGSATGSDLTISGIISTAFGLTKAGAGELTLFGTNTFTGGVNLNAGTLNINNAQALGTVAGTFTIAAGTTIDNTSGGAITTLNYPQAWNGNFTFTGTWDLNLGTGAVSMSADRQVTTTANRLTVGGIISGAASRLTKAGAGILILTGANTFTGGTTLNAGVLHINNAQALGTVAGTFIINGGTIDNTSTGAITTLNYPQLWNADFTFTGTRDLNLGTGVITMSASRQITTVTAGSTLTVGGIINNNTQNLTKAGAGTLVFVNQAITLNSLTISTGTLTSTSGVLSLAGNFSNNSTYTPNNGTISFDGTAAQTIGGTTATGFYNVIFNNDPGVAGDVTLATNNYIVSNQITMTRGNIDLNGCTLTLGTTIGTPGTLNYTAGFFYGSTGSFTRWVSATSAAMGAIASNTRGHFPMGTSGGSYRPLWFSYIANLSSGGSISVQHDPTPLTTAASHNDASWNGGTILQAVSNSNWVVSTANGFALNGATGRIRFGGQGYGSSTLADLDATLLASTVGTFGAATNTNTTIEVNRTGLTTANFANTWRIGTRDVSSSPLPIELLSFDAKPNGNEVVITWTTATEINNDFFTIERSADAITFENIGIIDGAGNSTSTLNYSLVDYNPYKGVSYYRLKQTDFDGKYTYSNIIAIEFGKTEEFIFNIYPNPTSAGENINLSITGNVGEEVLVVVYDVTGKKNYSKIVIVETKGDNIYALDESKKLSPGIYMISATYNQITYSKKLIVK